MMFVIYQAGWRVYIYRNLPDEAVRNTYGVKDKKNWSLNETRKALCQDHQWEQRIVSCLYRPFDRRRLFYSPPLIERGRFEVMRHMLAGKNLALIMSKRVEHIGSWQHVFTTEQISEHVAVSLKTTDYHFPLYLYPEQLTKDLFMVHDAPGPRPNLNANLLAALFKAYGKEPKPEAIFHYIYAVLHTPAYRQRYAEFLWMDFPRVPFAANFAM